ncbi:UNVERIFIED_CONTAM: hypothetical protein FKN15_008963 [Acipenser sinensis]
MDRNALAELLQALESRRDAEERRREERYTALIERAEGHCIIIAEGEEMVGTSSRAGMGGAQVHVKQEGTSPPDMRSARQEVNKAAYYHQLQYDATQDDLAMEVFVRGLTPTVLRQQVRLAASTFLELTVAHAERVEVYSRRGRMTGPLGGNRVSRRGGPITHHPEPAWPNPVNRKPRTAPAPPPRPQSWSPL